MGSSDQINVGLEADAQALDKMVGQWKNVEGPNFDKEGKNPFHGGGSIVVEGNENWYVAGHNSVYTFNNEDYLFFQAYDTKDGEKLKLKVKTITLDQNKWPN